MCGYKQKGKTLKIYVISANADIAATAATASTAASVINQPTN